MIFTKISLSNTDQIVVLKANNGNDDWLITHPSLLKYIEGNHKKTFVVNIF